MMMITSSLMLSKSIAVTSYPMLIASWQASREFSAAFRQLPVAAVTNTFY
jgi:hypothetical protein